MLAGRPFDVFDDLLARAFTCSSCLFHLPLLSGYDEPRTLSYQICLFGPISADVRQIDPETASDLDYYPLLKQGERFPIKNPNLEPRLTPRPESDVEFLHGMMESIARIEAQCYDAMRELNAPQPKAIYTAGGGASNPVWTAIRKRVMGLDIQSPIETEAAVGIARLIALA